MSGVPKAPWTYEIRLSTSGDPLHFYTGAPILETYGQVNAEAARLGYLSQHPDGRVGIYWPKMMEELRALRVAEYFHFSEEEKKLHAQMLCEAMVTIERVVEKFGMRPLQLKRWIEQMKIPVWFIGERHRMFVGDVLRAALACRLDFKNPVVRGYFGYSTQDTARRSAARQEARVAQGRAKRGRRRRRTFSGG